MAQPRSVPTPPRLTGSPMVDLAAVIEWAWAFYKAAELGNAFAKTSEVEERLDAMPSGTVTISGTNVSAQVQLPAVQEDTDYYVTLTAQSSNGTPTAGAYTVVGVAKTTTTFTVTVSAAPGAANSVTFAWQIQR